MYFVWSFGWNMDLCVRIRLDFFRSFIAVELFHDHFGNKTILKPCGYQVYCILRILLKGEQFLLDSLVPVTLCGR